MPKLQFFGPANPEKSARHFSRNCVVDYKCLILRFFGSFGFLRRGLVMRRL